MCKCTDDHFALCTESDSKLMTKVAKNQFAVSAIKLFAYVRILFLVTYAKIEYVCVRTCLSENRIRRPTLRLLYVSSSLGGN